MVKRINDARRSAKSRAVGLARRRDFARGRRALLVLSRIVPTA